MDTPHDLKAHMGPFIARRRAELGLSLQAVADLAGCAKTHIWELEKGRKPANPTIRFALGLCRALQCSLSSLIGMDVSQPEMTDDEIALIAAHRKIFKTATT